MLIGCVNLVDKAEYSETETQGSEKTILKDIVVNVLLLFKIVKMNFL